MKAENDFGPSPYPEPAPPRKKTLWLWLTGLLLVFIGLPVFLAWNFLIAPMLNWRDQYSRLLGKPKAEVVARLGPPRYALSAKQVKEKGIDAPIRGGNFIPVPTRVVRNEVLLYIDKEQPWYVIYIFIDERDRVEALDYAGT